MTRSVPNSDVAPRRAVALLAAITLLVAFSFAGARGLYETTEGRYAEAAREMIETGQYLEPQLAHRPHFTKPPLAYWAIAGGMALFGQNEFGARFPNGVAFAISVLAAAGIGRLLWDRRTGIVAGLVYATSLLAVGGMASLSTDTLLTMFELLFVLAWLAAVRAEGTPRARRYVWLAWLALGLGVLTKGPAALVPLAPTLAYDFLARRPFRLASPLGWVLFLLAGAGWYGVVVARNDGLLDFLLDQQLTGRLLATHHNRNPQWWWPLYAYLPLVLLGCGPWIVFAALAFRRRPELRPRALLARLLEPRPSTLLFFWIVPAFLVFSFAKSRLPLYVLPLCAPVALGLARAIVRSTERPLFVASRVAAPLSAALVAGGFAVGSMDHPMDMRALDARIDREAGEDAVVYAWEEDLFYGLRFYREGALVRISAEPERWAGADAARISAWDQRWADAPLDDALARIARAEGRSVVVTRGWRAGQIVERLRAAGIDFRRVDLKRWTLLVSPPDLRPAPPPAPR